MYISDEEGTLSIPLYRVYYDKNDKNSENGVYVNGEQERR